MASSLNSNQPTTEANITGSFLLDVLKDTLDVDTQSNASVESIDLSGINDTSIDNIVLSGVTDLERNRIVENANQLSQQERIINVYLENFGVVTEQLLATNNIPHNYIVFDAPVQFRSRSRAISPTDVRHTNFVEQGYYGIMTDQMYTDESQLPKKSAAYERYETIIREFKDTININNKALNSLTKEELVKLIIHLRDQLFNNSLLTSENDEETNFNNNQILRSLFDQSRNLTELMTKITETLPKLANIKTITHLSLAYIFVWTVKTQFIPAYSKYK